MNILHKVTAFVLREKNSQKELLLFRHPYAGNQIPAGTIEAGESPQEAALREVAEESGLHSMRIVRYLGSIDNELQPGEAVIFAATMVYARPDTGSFDWARLRPGIMVHVDRDQGDWCQVTYIEWDRYPDPQYTSMQITGWVPATNLARIKQRHFFHLELITDAQERWEKRADNHLFSFFWAPLNDLPPIVGPQYLGLDFLNHLSSDKD